MPTYKNNAVIWINKDKNGKTYFSFKAERDIKEGESFNFFKNDKAGVETRPDYKSYEKIEEMSPEQSEEIITTVDPNNIPF